MALQRAFWSAYGRLVWDEQTKTDPRVNRVVETLLAWRPAHDARVLDAGCGTGNYALALAKAGFQVTGLDYAPGMLARAQRKVQDAPAGSLAFQRASLDQPLPFADGSYDYALNISVLQVVADPPFTLRELRRVLRPGGRLLLLHVPAPATRPTLRQDIATRMARMEHPRLWQRALVALKCASERAGAARHWTKEQLCAMLSAAEFGVLSVEEGPALVVAAERRS